ncbi:DUF6177 family protein [Streptomyces sp. NPDC005562]|uniref:DUF6177 family protein n=1 Tax=Streptomyces sp. NPDC005562 TaxID=3154890 RepID=UPI0033AAD57E
MTTNLPSARWSSVADEMRHTLLVDPTRGTQPRPAIATTHISHTSAGVEERVTLGYASDEVPPVDALAPLAEALSAEHSLVSMLTTLRPARRDLTVPPRFEGPPVPLTFTLGADAVHDIGLAHARHPPTGPRPSRLGPSARPALHYILGDGTDASCWSTFQQLTRHLRESRP